MVSCLDQLCHICCAMGAELQMQALCSCGVAAKRTQQAAHLRHQGLISGVLLGR